jgi:hypothetical protein
MIVRATLAATGNRAAPWGKMLKLISKETALRLMSFPMGKKVAFLLLLYERMRPATYFYLAEGLAFSVFQEAREKFWASLIV